MNYVAITTDEVLQGEGLRVALWCSGCEIKCSGCHNKAYWDKNFGQEFDDVAFDKICKELDKDYIAGLSVLGGNPTDSYNIECVTSICRMIKNLYPKKDIWLWSGHKYEQLVGYPLLKYIDVLVDGEFIEELKDNTDKCQWRGSTNQEIIDVQLSLKKGEKMLYNING